MSIGTVYLRPSRLAYVRATGPYEEAAPRAWELLLTWLSKNGFSSALGRGYGMMRDNPFTVALEKCRYDACVDLDPMFEERAIRELSAQTLPGGSYVRLRRSGDYNTLRREVTGFYQRFEAPAGLRLEDRRPIVTVYLDNPKRFAAHDLRADVCVPVSAHPKRGGEEDGREAA